MEVKKVLLVFEKKHLNDDIFGFDSTYIKFPEKILWVVSTFLWLK